MLAFLTVGVRGNWGFVLGFRGTKLAGLVMVGTAVAVSTVVFQTLTQNRILTPAVMGFDALFVVFKTLLVFALGAQAVLAFDPRGRFLVEALVMVAAALALFRLLFADGRNSLHLLLLTGVVFGVLCRSLAGLLQRILDPNAFAVLQGLLFAQFNAVDTTLLPLAVVVIVVASGLAFHLSPTLDVLSLGRETAINLGVNYRRVVALLMALVAVLVSVSTALVGPVLFFGLLVANLAYHLVGTDRHRYTLPAAVLLAVICLAGGQMVLERLLNLGATLSVVIEFVGGLVFIALLLRRDRT
ncbi:iron chelate uptake ABC transporter family permease subunit [Xanthobacter sp. V4C-4]|uniref:iron chelate uptake ABC transporter family permease subunit n=1 Tax=Xanthobacter cornucopiae TaxID=3119924 RepID=UPI0037262A22